MFASILYSILTLILLLSAILRRQRIRRIPVLQPAEETPAPDHLFLATEGPAPCDAVQRAASRHARENNLEMLDLVPADLPAEQLMLLMGFYSPCKYRSNRIGGAVSAGRALLIQRERIARAGCADQYPQDRAAFFALAKRLKKFTAGRADLAVAPLLQTGEQTPLNSFEHLRLISGKFTRPVLLAQLGSILFILLGLAAAPVAAGLALLALHLQPFMATFGTCLRPRDLVSACLLRSPLLLAAAIIGLAALPRRDRAAAAQARKTHNSLLAREQSSFFMTRRETCPLCDGNQLTPVVRTPELVVHKPGTFSLEQCDSCSHIFQNPLLSPVGLEFYYRDLYDGLGADLTELILGSDDAPYHKRAGLFSRHCPASGRWLDVGGGNGYFCCVAHDAFPDFHFDGLDISNGMACAEEQSWVQRAYIGQFTKLAESFAETYDVVSMIQYLEHTTDPAAQLKAAHRALADEGTLIIEVPNPDFPPGRLLGPYWFQWLQPQHLYFFTTDNLDGLLRKCGFEPEARYMHEVHIPIDCVTAAVLFLRCLAPPAHYPWRPEPGPLYSLWRWTIFTVGSPLVALGLLGDILLLPITRLRNISNNYTVIARKAQ
ncbi:MAG: class I SAM-dependent methyltransferase [Deltaproteobacteria bacterium]|nr:class I SAM-dependent methyltransferase [Deltaproteobacteria bacterium]